MRHTRYNKRKLFHKDDDFKKQFEHIVFNCKKENNHQGDINELEVAIQHMRRGCKVYRNMGSTGHTDMIIEYPNGVLLRVDVKQLSSVASTKRHKIGLARSPLQQELDVRYVAVKGRKIFYTHHNKGNLKRGKKNEKEITQKFHKDIASY